jgi:tRNA pseudouridine38-40 synthase
MARFRLLIEYEGTRYHGWQQNAGVKTIQGEMLKACQAVFNTAKSELYGAGRTDAGVHALGQVAHLDVPSQMPTEKITPRLNELLPYDIHILKTEACSATFHARHDAVARSYVYAISKRRSAFGKHYAWWVKEDLSVAAMQEVAALFAGFHDFASFGAASPDDKSTTVNILRTEVREEGDMVFVHIAGSHFLWMMVRRLVGVMVHAGKGKLKPREVKDFLHRHSERPAQLAAPPAGLYLHRIYYPGESLDFSYSIPVRVGWQEGTAG